MLSTPAITQEQFDNGRAKVGDLLLFDLSETGFENIKAFFSGAGELVYNSQTYIGADGMFEVGPVSANTEGVAESLSIKLASAQSLGLDPLDLVTSIETLKYQGKTVQFTRAYFDVETLVLLSVHSRFSGYIDVINYVDSDDEFFAEIICESRSLDFSRSGTAVMDDINQRSIGGADDGFLKHVQNTAAKKIYWGRSTPQSLGTSRGS